MLGKGQHPRRSEWKKINCWVQTESCLNVLQSWYIGVGLTSLETSRSDSGFASIYNKSDSKTAWIEGGGVKTWVDSNLRHISGICDLNQYFPLLRMGDARMVSLLLGNWDYPVERQIWQGKATPCCDSVFLRMEFLGHNSTVPSYLLLGSAFRDRLTRDK